MEDPSGYYTFGDWLRTWRKVYGHSQKALGAQIGYSAKQIGRIEGGEYNCAANQAYQLASVVGLPTEEVLAFTRWATGGQRPARLTLPEPPATSWIRRKTRQPKTPELGAYVPWELEEGAGEGAEETRRPGWRKRLIGLGVAAIVCAVVVWGGIRILGSRNQSTAETNTLGGVWIGPARGFIVREQTLQFSARAYGGRGGSVVQYVNFTATWPGPGGDWRLACTVFTPSPGTVDMYECDWPLPAELPDGPITVSFDVYDQQRRFHKAPHGIRQGTVER